MAHLALGRLRPLFDLSGRRGDNDHRMTIDVNAPANTKFATNFGAFFKQAKLNRRRGMASASQDG
jgi:hypothetical protein